MDAKETVEQMLKGGKGEFESIVEIYYAKALRLAYLISGSYDDSQDIVQETFTACYLNRSKIKEPQYFERYLYKTLSRKAWSYCKKIRREQPVDEIFDENTADSFSVADNFIHKQESREIFGIILSLPIKQRTAVILYYYNGLSTKEIAKITGSFEGTVKSRLFSARKAIKKHLEAETGFKNEKCKAT